MTDHPAALVSVPRVDLERIEKKLRHGGWPTDAKSVRAMLAAAPAAPQAAGVEEDDGARLLWNRFAVAHHESWDDEPNKAEYRQAAADVLALRAPSREPEGGVSDGWIEWSGGDNPAPGQRVEVRLRSGRQQHGLSHAFHRSRMWEHSETEPEKDIVAYRALATREEAPAEAGKDTPAALVEDFKLLAEIKGRRAQPQAREDAQPVGWPEAWSGPCTVGNMISNLRTLPLEMPLYSAYHISMGDKPSLLKVKRPTLSCERVDGNDIKTGDENIPYSAVIWTEPRNFSEATDLTSDVAGDWKSIAMWMGFAASVIKSGEPWTSQCQREFDEAKAAYARLSITHPAPDALRVREALSALVIADDHRPSGMGNTADWMRHSYGPAIALARQALAALQAEQGAK